MHLGPCGRRSKKRQKLDWGLSLRRGGNWWSFLRGEESVVERGGNVRGGSIALQQAIKKKLAMSPVESWPCCSLALSSPCVPLFLPCLVK